MGEPFHKRYHSFYYRFGTGLILANGSCKVKTGGAGEIEEKYVRKNGAGGSLRAAHRPGHGPGICGEPDPHSVPGAGDPPGTCQPGDSGRALPGGDPGNGGGDGAPHRSHGPFLWKSVQDKDIKECNKEERIIKQIPLMPRCPDVLKGLFHCIEIRDERSPKHAIAYKSCLGKLEEMVKDQWDDWNRNQS